MNKKILVSILAVGILAFVHLAEAQQPGIVHRIGFVSARADPTPTTPDSSADALRQGLRNLGYIEGKNIVVEYRYFEGKVDRIPSLVAELLPLKLDVLVSVNTLAIRAFKQATKTLPIVIVINDDPVTTGIVNSFKDWFAEEDLRRKIYSGVAVTFLEVRQLLALTDLIARNAVVLNRELGNLFGYLQKSLGVLILIAVDQLYEKQDPTGAHSFEHIFEDPFHGPDQIFVS